MERLIGRRLCELGRAIGECPMVALLAVAVHLLSDGDSDTWVEGE